MKIALITDIHLGRDTNIPGLLGDTVNLYGSHFTELFARIKSDFESVDLVVNLGDFIHDEDTEKDIALYTEGMETMRTRTLTKYVAGNHDLRNISREKLASHHR